MIVAILALEDGCEVLKAVKMLQTSSVNNSNTIINFRGA